MSAPQLRDYQAGSLDAVADQFFNHRKNRLLVKKPTGTGKTVTFAHMLKYGKLGAWLRERPKKGARMLVIAHRDELLNQARDTISRINPGLMVAIEKAELVASRHVDVVVASIQTLAARNCTRLKRLAEAHSFDIVIVDEAHHAAAKSYRTVLALLGFLPMAEAAIGSDDVSALTHDDVAVMERELASWDKTASLDRLLVGVTATPNRSDSIGLGCVFQTIAYSYALKQAISDGWLVPPVPWVIETAESLDDVRITAGEFNQKDLADAVNNPRRNELAVESWKLHAHDRSTLAFTVDVQHAHDLAAMFRAKGIAAAAVSGETHIEERRQILADYTAGKIQVIANCMVLTEGTDLPRTGCILHCKPTRSATLYEQMTGRGLRLFDGKKDCLVIDLVDIARKHSLQTAPVLYGLPPGLMAKGKDLRQVAKEFDELRDQNPTVDFDAMLQAGRFSIEELRDRASTFNVWSVPDLGDLASVVTLNWLRTRDNTWRLQYPWQDGTETVSVEPDTLDHFDVVTTLRPREKHLPTRQSTIARQVANVKEALKLAESFVHQHRHNVTRLAGRNAAWRGNQPTDKQLKFARALGINVPKGCTSGQLSNLIDIAKATKGSNTQRRRW